MSKAMKYPTYQARSGWNALLPARVPRTQAPKETHFRTIVIGAGVTGMAAARRIAEIEPDDAVLLIDAAFVGEGSSARNSGFLINLPHNTGMSGHGSPIDVARKQIALYREGLAWLKSLIDAHGIECGWNPVGKFHAAATPDGREKLRAALRNYKEWGVAYKEYDQDALFAALGTSHYQYGYHSDNNVFVNPAALVRGLAQALPKNVVLWEGMAVDSLHAGQPWKIRTGAGELSADRVIVTNNGFARKLGFARDRVFTIYTYAALTDELDAESLEKLGRAEEWGVIPAQRLGTTLRKASCRRFMVRSGYSYEREASLEKIRADLQACYRMRYPDMRSHALPLVWGGVTALTRNGALYFGQAARDLYISIGCNGAGMLKGSVFGKLLGEMACGQQSPQLADALGFERPSWLPPEPLRGLAVRGAIAYQRRIAGVER